MSTWIAAIVASGRRPDFWSVASAHGIRPLESSVPEYVLVDCNAGFQFDVSIELAAAVSRELGTNGIGFVAQTAVDVYEIEVFEAGRRVRRLAYSRDEGGWLEVLGVPQRWEPAFFFGDEGDAVGELSDMMYDDVTDDDLALYERAKRHGDVTAAIHLLHPSSLRPLHRLCRHFEVDPQRPSATWRGPSLWSRIVGAFGGRGRR